MEIIAEHWGDWLIVAGLLALALYTLRVIRRESSDFIDEARWLTFRELQIPVPEWWGQTRDEASYLQFERTDTRYDWYARFMWIDDPRAQPLHEHLAEKIGHEELDYDPLDVVMSTLSASLLRDPVVREHVSEFIRVEGQASMRIEERIYLDLVLMRPKNQSGYFLFESRSSVLNGLLEGPFFEECLAEMRLKEA